VSIKYIVTIAVSVHCKSCLISIFFCGSLKQDLECVCTIYVSRVLTVALLLYALFMFVSVHYFCEVLCMNNASKHSDHAIVS
jgi:hypothetical protein